MRALVIPEAAEAQLWQTLFAIGVGRKLRDALVGILRAHFRALLHGLIEKSFAFQRW
jgi:hypothetical protein